MLESEELELPELELLLLPELVVLPEFPELLMLLKGLLEFVEDLLELSLKPLRLLDPLRSLMVPPRMETLSRSWSTTGS